MYIFWVVLLLAFCSLGSTLGRSSQIFGLIRPDYVLSGARSHDFNVFDHATYIGFPPVFSQLCLQYQVVSREKAGLFHCSVY